MKTRYLIPILLYCFLEGFVHPWHHPAKSQSPGEYTMNLEEWVDSVMNTLTLRGKIAQLMSVRAYSNRGEDHVQEVTDLIRNHSIGGLTFFQGGPVRQAQLTNYYQELSEIPLLISMDAEWGLGMRLDSCHSFPYQMTLGAMDDDDLVESMAAEIARQLKCIGVQMNFAPVVDINNNPQNPVIHVRSFGEDRYRVASMSMAYMDGMRQYGILTTAKHFPGHGDTDTDSHHELPVIAHSRQRLDSIELFPYREMIPKGLSAVMTAHIHIPAIDPADAIPASLSSNVVTGILRNDMGFAGLVVTDALDMKGVGTSLPPGEIEVHALLAGNDVLLLPLDVPLAINRIEEAVGEGLIPSEGIEERCRRVLQAKYQAGLSTRKPTDITGLAGRLNHPENIRIERSVYREAITLVWNPDSVLPLRPDSLRLASLSIGADSITPFQWMLGHYAPVDHFFLPTGWSAGSGDRLIQVLQPYDAIIIGLHDLPVWKKQIDQRVMKVINALKDQKQLFIAVFGHPYLLASFADLSQISGLVMSYQDVVSSQEITAQMLFGSLAFKGRLPVTASLAFPVHTGIKTEPNGRLTFVAPEEMNMDLDGLYRIDKIVGKAINEQVFPGCQILALKDGKVFYDRCFGYHTYERKREVRPTDLYDLASVTKVAASTLAVMQLYEQGYVDIDRMLGDYLPYLRGTDKGTIIIREMMAHQSRLAPWIKFYGKFLQNGTLDTGYFRTVISETFPVRICEGLYIHRDFHHILFDTIVRSPLLQRQVYKYSDLGFYFLLQVIEQVTNMPFEDYMDRHFYHPLGLSSTSFRPQERFPLERIVPTEYDTEFRKQLVHGDVHDPGAAMLGGVSCHAGLFANAGDLAVILQMLLQQGEYQGCRYLEPETVAEFTRYQFPLTSNRRGIGFDKPPMDNQTNGPVCRSASPSSFGHSGFTGTYIWADPENNLAYVFLSNRIHPDASNTKLIDQEIRTRIHELFYQALKGYSLSSSSGTNRK